MAVKEAIGSGYTRLPQELPLKAIDPSRTGQTMYCGPEPTPSTSTQSPRLIQFLLHLLAHTLPCPTSVSTSQSLKYISSTLTSNQSFHLCTSPNPFQLPNVSYKLAKIHSVLLKRFDPEVYERLQELDVAPEVYGM